MNLNWTTKATLGVILLAQLSACACARPSPGPKDVLDHLVSALNTKSPDKIREFVTQWADPGIPIQDRVENLADLADQGAPFTLVTVTKETPKLIEAVLSDRNRIQLSLSLQCTDGSPSKMIIVNLRPVGAALPGEIKAPQWDSISDLVEKIALQRKAPAMGIAMVRNGELTKSVFGIREIGKDAKVTADEPWSIGSIGKPLCTTVIGLLIEQGKLRWDETLKEALPGFKMQPGYEGVTLEQLMKHRGGVPQDGNFNAKMVEKIVGEAKTPTAIRENYARDILSREPIGKPGEKFAYSNAGFALLGVVAERATGKGYEQLVHEMVFKPLGMNHSYTGIDPLPENRPSGHMDRGDGLKPVNMSGPLEFMVAPAGGGMSMSTTDLAKFGAAHLKGLRGEDGLLKASTVARLHQGISERGGPFLYACGWGIESNPSVETFHGHNGSNGTFRAQLAIFPEANLVVAAFVNCGGEEEPSPGLEATLAIAERYAKKGN